VIRTLPRIVRWNPTNFLPESVRLLALAAVQVWQRVPEVERAQVSARV
jgi:hypothetical protein